MKTRITSTQKNRKRMWLLIVHHGGKKNGEAFWFACRGQEVWCTWVDWGLYRKRTACNDTILSVARNQYLTEYCNSNYNPAKPKQKGYTTTEQRVNNFINWFIEDWEVREVTTKDWHDYLANPKWGHTTKRQYGNSEKIFMSWCARQGYGQDKSDWDSTTNKSLILSSKKKFHTLPRIWLSVKRGKTFFPMEEFWVVS